MIFGQHEHCRREQDEVICLDCGRRFSINDEVYPPCGGIPTSVIRDEIMLKGWKDGK